MSLTVFVGPSNIGKSYSIKHWLLPTLLGPRPDLATEMAPAGGYTAALIDDPRTAKHPEGQYPGPRFRDVAEWMRGTDRLRVACLEHPSFDAMCLAARELGGLVLVVDELERAFAGSPSEIVVEMCIAARNHNSLVVGGCKRLGNLPTKARSNLERVFFGNLSDRGDREDCAKQTGIPVRELEQLSAVGGPLTEQGTFLEWDARSGWRGLTRVVDRRKITLQTL
jgi:hypothetical protein